MIGAAPGLRRRLRALRRAAAGAALYWSGASAAFETLSRPTGAIILMYHSVADTGHAPYVDPPNRLSPRLFERQMAFLSSHRRVIALSALLRTVSEGKSPPAGTVCLTFDDGYLDNLTVAAPILERYGLPATLYLPTAIIDRAEAQWADVLHWLLAFRTADMLSLPNAGLHAASLRSPFDRARVRRHLHPVLLEAAHSARMAMLREIERQLAPSMTMPRLTMNWDDVRHLQERYPLFEIGGHTREHIDLRTHRAEAAVSQVEGCAEDLRRELGTEPVHFSFPYARWCDETREIVRRSGWRSAVGMGDEYRIGANSDLFTMPRVESPRTMTELRFKTSGAYPGSLALLGLR